MKDKPKERKKKNMSIKTHWGNAVKKIETLEKRVNRLKSFAKLLTPKK